jgi:transcriptional regulator with XRE-family HTH domain
MKKSRTIGSVIRERREAQGLSVRGLAKLVGVAPSSILRVEAGDIAPSNELVGKLAKTLKLKASELSVLAHGPLPELGLYLRAKYDLPPDAVAQMQQAFQDAAKRHSSKGSKS